MIRVDFVKYSGAGNDFVLIDAELNKNFELTSESIKKICDRRNGIGSDGILYIKPSTNNDYELEYYNSDGSLGTLCGNGSRCSIKYAYVSNKFRSKRTKFSCNNVLYEGEVFEDGSVKFFLQPPYDLVLSHEIEIGGHKIKGATVNTGSAHMVIKVEDLIRCSDNKSYTDLSEVPVAELGRAIRYCDYFAPAGMNVNFIQIKNGIIYIRTYERGVEDETHACGTGSTASALIANLKYGLSSPVKLITYSGETLTVEFEQNNNVFNNVALIGPAKEIFAGYIYL